MPALAPPSPGPTSPSRTLLTATLADAPLRRALDASDNAVVMTNSSKRVVYVNEGFTRLLGYQPAEVLEARRDIRAAGSEINAWGLLFHATKGNCTV